MHEHYEANYFGKNFGCYDAKSIKEANVLVIWGSISKLLCELLQKQASNMLKNRFIIHIQGCTLRLDNLFSSPNVIHLSINTVFSDCNLSSDDYRTLIKEARQCLIA